MSDLHTFFQAPGARRVDTSPTPSLLSLFGGSLATGGPSPSATSTGTVQGPNVQGNTGFIASNFIFPVAGGGQYSDDFGAGRSGGRSHAGTDIFADRGTPVVASVNGTINSSSYGDSQTGGMRVWLEGEDGKAYYYAHLDSITVEPGAQVSAGDQLGTVGNTGNARGTPPHLHFSINSRVGSEEGNINPYPTLQAADQIDSPAGGTSDPAISSPQPSTNQATGSSTGSTTPLPASPEEIDNFVRDNYGFMSWALDHEEIGPILEEAATNGWSEGRLMGALGETDWWQENSEPHRQWQALEAQDPAEARRQIGNMASQIGEQATSFGLEMSQGELNTLARNALQLGWSDQQIRQNVIQHGRETEGARFLNDLVRIQFGSLGWAVDHHELGPLLRKAANQQWPEQRLTAELQQTAWWAQTSESQRQWQALERGDPASAARQIEQAAAQINNTAHRLGIQITEDRVLSLARQALKFNWEEEELQAALASEMERGQIDSGQITAFQDQARAMAKQEFFLPMSEQQAFTWAQRMVHGAADENAIRSSLVQHAASRFPEFSERIQAGETPREIFDPYIESAAQLLEIDPGQVDPTDDPRFSAMTEHIDSDGNRRAMTLSEWQRYVRHLPDYQNTDRAMNEASNLSLAMANAFGVQPI